MRFDEEVRHSNIVKHFRHGVSMRDKRKALIERQGNDLLQRSVDHDLNRSVDNVMVECYHDVKRFLSRFDVVVVMNKMQLLPPLRRTGRME